MGVHRESVTEAADKLHKAGLIAYHHWRIIIVDRAGLEARFCGCYETVKQENDSMLSYSRAG
ncbi:helix-turn-helix domain-containing protein [Halomonas sp. 18H]|nr:helix-turn-helix domain-containing protein [Halomonas sp. 18H]MCW4150267.1 helix-turn-helix domain-containing protein [Halomonas sp. 18H]